MPSAARASAISRSRCAARQDAVERGARRGRMLVGPRRREDDVPRAGVPELRDEPRHVERVDGLLEVAAPPVLVGGARRPVHADPERSREPVGRRARVAVRRVRRAERLRDTPPERLAEDRPLRRAVDERLGVDPLERLAGREVDRPANAGAALERERVDPLQARARREGEAGEAGASVEGLHPDDAHARRNHEVAAEILAAHERRAAELLQLRWQRERVRRVLARVERGATDGAHGVRQRERAEPVVPRREAALDCGGLETGVGLDARERVERPVALRRLPDLLEDDPALVRGVRLDADLDRTVVDGAALLVDRPRGARGGDGDEDGKGEEDRGSFHARDSAGRPPRGGAPFLQSRASEGARCRSRGAAGVARQAATSAATRRARAYASAR